MKIKEACDYSPKVAFQGKHVPIESNRPQGIRRVAANAGQPVKLSLQQGQMPIEAVDNDLSRAVKVAGARVVTQAFPQFKYLFLGRIGQSRRGREAGHKTFVVWKNRVDPRLLKHDLGHPDRIGIVGVAPWQVASVVCVPGEKIVGKHG